MPYVPVPLLLPSDGVNFMNEVVAGSPINFLNQVRNRFVVHGRGESTHKPPTPSFQLPLAVMRLLPPLIVVLALLGGYMLHPAYYLSRVRHLVRSRLRCSLQGRKACSPPIQVYPYRR